MRMIDDVVLSCIHEINEADAVDAKLVPNIGDISDGYHTFNELYHHRAILFSVICNSNPDIAWKSKRHYTGDMYDGMFIVGIETPEGQATYHYDIDKYWELFKVKELERAPKWDGHTSDDAIRRISSISGAKMDEKKPGMVDKMPECKTFVSESNDAVSFDTETQRNKRKAIEACLELTEVMQAVIDVNDADWSNDEEFEEVRKTVAEKVASSYIALVQLVDIYDIADNIQGVVDRQIDHLSGCAAKPMPLGMGI